MRTNNDEEIQELFEKISKDPSLASSIDIDKLLQTIDKGNTHYLSNKNTEYITNEIAEAIIENGWGRELSTKLCGYRLVTELHELHKGKYIRWAKREPDGKLTNGGIVVNITFSEKGTYIVCKTNQHRIIQFHFDNYVTFQKMSLEEQLILLANDYTHRN